MPMTMGERLTDQNGQPCEIGPLIASGGEGSVYQIVGNSALVAKIYHRRPEGPKVAKLCSMVRLSEPALTKHAAWPTSVLHKGSDVVGVVLPRLSHAQEIYRLYSPAERRCTFPSANWQFLVHSARNTAAAFASLHQRGIIIGDVNQGNVFVARNAISWLIDCDSFQITNGNHLFLCEVGVPHFTPPELQSAQFSRTPRTTNHDNFGLAILIFHLLFMGRHPFAGRYLGAGEMPIEKAIAERRFAFGANASRLQMAPPPKSLTLNGVSPEIGALFEQAFCQGSELPDARPNAATWARRLEHLASSLAACAQDPGHLYWKGRGRCPWCEIEGQGGPNFFISVTMQKLAGKTAQFDITAWWRNVAAISAPKTIALDLSPVSNPVPKAQPLPMDCLEHDSFQRILLLAAGCGVIFTISGAVFQTAFYFGIPIFLLFTIWWFILYAISPFGRERRVRREVLRQAAASLRQVNRQFAKQLTEHQQKFMNVRSTLQNLRVAYGDLATLKSVELTKLHDAAESRQKHTYLHQIIITELPQFWWARGLG
jgi:DNA-binding helix-hairpin-helix protein with protein kinase domain